MAEIVSHKISRLNVLSDEKVEVDKKKWREKKATCNRRGVVKKKVGHWKTKRKRAECQGEIWRGTRMKGAN